YQHVAGFELSEVIRVGEHVDSALTDLFSDSDTGNQRRAVLTCQFISLEIGLAIRGMNGFGPSLKDEQFTGVSILGPFDIHRCRPPGTFGIMRLDQAGPARQLQNFIDTDAEAASLRFANFA